MLPLLQLFAIYVLKNFYRKVRIIIVMLFPTGGAVAVGQIKLKIG